MISGSGRSTLVPAGGIRTSTPCSRRSTTAGSRRSPCMTSSASDKGVRGFIPPPERSWTPRASSRGRSTLPTCPPAPDSVTFFMVHPPLCYDRPQLREWPPRMTRLSFGSGRRAVPGLWALEQQLSVLEDRRSVVFERGDQGGGISAL